MEYLKFRPQEIPYSKEVDQADRECLIAPSSKRSSTNLFFLILQGCVSIIFLIFLGYCILNGDIQRVIKGHDDCGNVCGKINNFEAPPDSECKAMDMTNKPFLLINGNHSSCVESCSDSFILELYSCVPEYDPTVGAEVFVHTIFIYLHLYSNQVIYLTLIAVASAIVMLLILRYLTAIFVWTSIIGYILACLAGTIYYGYKTSQDIAYLYITIVLTIATLVVFFAFVFLKNRIPLVIALFKESGKAIGAIPLLLFQPILTFITLALVWSAWVDFALWIESAGTPVMENSQITFYKNPVVIIARWYNHLIMIWMVCFIFGCQSMVLSGAVSKWFFTRNKSNLGSPICRSAYNTVRYHLGTISIGSLILLIMKLVQIVLVVVRLLLRRTFVHLCLCVIYQYLETLVAYVERTVQILTRNAYCITAIHGYGFGEAGKRAWEIILNNALSILAVHSVSTYVLVLAKMLVVLVTMLIGFVLTNIEQRDILTQLPAIFLVGIIAYLIADCFFSVYEMTANTIFVCYCEDIDQNDGMTRPYFMSIELKQFAEDCKVIVPQQAPKRPPPAYIDRI